MKDIDKCSHDLVLHSTCQECGKPMGSLISRQYGTTQACPTQLDRIESLLQGITERLEDKPTDDTH